MNGSRTLQQLRAAHALAAVEKRKSPATSAADAALEIARKEQARYVSYVNALPATIVMNGLGQAVAMLLAQAKGVTNDPHHLLYDDVQSWLCDNEALPSLALEGDLIQAIVKGDQRTYVIAQAEALAYCTWLKRFAVAYLEAPETPGAVE